ncbi:dihydroorotase [Spiroplasma chrysopicola]|uniref:Dihydroorotase n=1 Tax=Spiroplasma chrysopicola DF-1 TaxID=1276227 RepID=R4UHM3_9MOLU|nr:dihydroorotase [Spiroplasma chrysopicola]AGM24831.1 dihydroorotase [Spiroplasma chrysopicola DF-1]
MIYTFSHGQIYYQQEFINQNITIENNKIINIGPEIIGTEIKLPPSAIIVPSFIDLHAHFREPGQTTKEDFVTGSLSALYGGYQTVCLMANTIPTIDNLKLLKALLTKTVLLPINIQFFAAITKNLAGIVPAPWNELKDYVIGFSDDGNYLVNEEILLAVLEYADKEKKLVSLHVDSRQKLLKEKVILNKRSAKKFHLKGVNWRYEGEPLARDLRLINKKGLGYHLCHISTAKSVKLVRKYKKKNPKLSCEVTPHHLTLSIKDIKNNNGNYMMNPPLNLKKDQRSLIRGLNEGVIDVIATDHAPHLPVEKDSFATGVMGVIGLQLTFPVLYTKLVRPKLVDLATIIAALTVNPQKLINHDPVELEVNQKANFTIIDLALNKIVTSTLLKSKGKNTPFIGEKLVGWPIINVYNGNIHYLTEDE